MRKLSNLFLACSLTLSLTSTAQIQTPQPSPTATLTQKVGLTDVEVVYSRPGMKSRTVFGGLVPYGEVWRTGANASTKVSFSDDVTVGGQSVPAGQYALYTIPGEKEWTIIIHKNTTLGGSAGYDQKEDLCRFSAPVKEGCMTETFTIDFHTLTTTGAMMSLAWDDVKVSFPIETKAMEMVEEQIKEILVEGPSAGTYYNAARFYLDQEKNLDQALVWINKACEKRPDAFWYTHQKAQILAKLGRTKEAIAAAEASMAAAKASEDGDFGYVASNEALIAELKAKKK